MAQLPSTANTSSNTSSNSAQLPDWTGVWRLKGSPAVMDREDGKSFVAGTRDHPPYNAEWEKRYTRDLVRAEHQGDANYPDPMVDTHTVFCAAGMPHLMGTPFDYEFVVTPAKTWIVADKETRHIYTDGRKFLPADEMWPTLLGTSIGHWEGQTLVVETISMRSDVWADTTPTMFSDQMRITERIRRMDANTMENQLTITDPVAFTKPWTFTKHYTLMKKGTWVSEPEKCGGPEDRNPIVNGRVISVMPGVTPGAK